MSQMISTLTFGRILARSRLSVLLRLVLLHGLHGLRVAKVESEPVNVSPTVRKEALGDEEPVDLLVARWDRLRRLVRREVNSLEALVVDPKVGGELVVVGDDLAAHLQDQTLSYLFHEFSSLLLAEAHTVDHLGLICLVWVLA